jgi:hypothetical protein
MASVGAGGGGGRCSASQAEVMLGFLEAAIHTILYTRRVYPPELFEQRRKYNVPVRMARHPALRDYIASLLTSEQLGYWLQQGLVEQLVLAILAPDGQPLERFVFELGNMLPAAPRQGGDSDMEDLVARAMHHRGTEPADGEQLVAAAEGALRACLIRLGGCGRSLHPTAKSELSFSIVLHMRGEGAELGQPSQVHPHATDAWVEAVGLERCEHGVGVPAGSSDPDAAAAAAVERHSSVVPLKDVQVGPEISLRVFVTEDPTLKSQRLRAQKRAKS